MAKYRSPSYLGMASGLRINGPTDEPFNDEYLQEQYESYPMDKSPVLNGSTGAFENSMHEDLKASNDDSVTNQRYADLQLRRDELKQQIMDLKADIAYQEKLRGLEMSKDPMWDAAKYKFIYDNDSSALENIMNRQQTMKVAKMNKEKEQTEKKEADERSAKFARDILIESLKDYDSSYADPNKRIEAGRNLLDKYMQYKEKAETAGLSEGDLFKSNPEALQRVNLAIEEARNTVTDEINKKKAEVDATAVRNAKTTKLQAEVDARNNMPEGERKLERAKEQLWKQQNPDYVITWDGKSKKYSIKLKAGVK